MLPLSSSVILLLVLPVCANAVWWPGAEGAAAVTAASQTQQATRWWPGAEGAAAVTGASQPAAEIAASEPQQQTITVPGRVTDSAGISWYFHDNANAAASTSNSMAPPLASGQQQQVGGLTTGTNNMILGGNTQSLPPLVGAIQQTQPSGITSGNVVTTTNLMPSLLASGQQQQQQPLQQQLYTTNSNVVAPVNNGLGGRGTILGVTVAGTRGTTSARLDGGINTIPVAATAAGQSRIFGESSSESSGEGKGKGGKGKGGKSGRGRTVSYEALASGTTSMYGGSIFSTEGTFWRVAIASVGLASILMVVVTP